MESLMQGSSRSVIGLSVVLLLLLSGCGAAYSGYVSRSLNQLEKGNYEAALGKLEKPSGKTNKLLYHLEKGLILHYQGQYEASNVEFERAERLSDQLYTRSVSREIAALLSNDSIVAYRGEEFELALIHYYRAMNYARLGDRQAALVECRKANLKLENYAQQAEYELSYKNDAFLQYMTGLFFEAEGEWNDAYISYKDALKGYRAYEAAFDLQAPRMLIIDLARLAQRLGYEDEVAEYTERYQLEPAEMQPTSGGELVVFVESGFVPRKHQVEFSVPILEGRREVGGVDGVGAGRPSLSPPARVQAPARGLLASGGAARIPGGALAGGRGAVARWRPECAGGHSRGLGRDCPADLCAEIRYHPAARRRPQLGQVPSVQEH